MAKKGVKYFFRGSIKGFQGNDTAADIQITYASANPAVALIFAIFCRPFPGQKVIYFADADKLKGIEKRYNRKASSLRKREEETGFVISHTDFYKRCEGYLDKSIVAKIFRDELGIELSPCVSIDDCLNMISPIKEEQIEKFWHAAMREISNNRGQNLADDLGIGPD